MPARRPAFRRVCPLECRSDGATRSCRQLHGHAANRPATLLAEPPGHAANRTATLLAELPGHAELHGHAAKCSTWLYRLARCPTVLQNQDIGPRTAAHEMQRTLSALVCFSVGFFEIRAIPGDCECPPCETCGESDGERL